MSDKLNREEVLARLKARTPHVPPKYRTGLFKAAPAKPFASPEDHEVRAELLRPPDVVPAVLVSTLALAKMEILVGLAKQEVGWLGTARRVGNDVAVDDVFLFDQEVSGGHCEISENAQNDLVMQLLKRPDGLPIVNSMKFWGHSHGNGGTWPSGQDDLQVVKFHEQGAEFYLRAVCNRDGDVNFSFYDWEQGLVYHHLPFRVVGRPLNVERRAALKAELKAEFKKRVKEGSWSGGYGYKPVISYGMGTTVCPSLHDMLGLSAMESESPATVPESETPDAAAPVAPNPLDPESWGQE